MAESEGKPAYENISVDKEGNLVLTKKQYVKLANYIEELRAENERLKLKLEQAKKEIEEAYEQRNIFDITRLSDTITGAGIASLLILLATGVD